MERAGLTDAPDREAAAKWIATSVNGMANGARPAARFVETRITRMKAAVKTISRMSAPIAVMPCPGAVTPAATADCPATTNKTAAPPTADDKPAPPPADSADDLSEDVADGIGRLDTAVQDRRDRDGRVEMAA